MQVLLLEKEIGVDLFGEVNIPPSQYLLSSLWLACNLRFSCLWSARVGSQVPWVLVKHSTTELDHAFFVVLFCF